MPTETRVMFIGDVHYSCEPPRARTDKYPEHILGKLKWIAAAAKKLNVSKVVCTGDLFHRKKPREQDITALIKVFKEFPTGEVVSILGNHDTVVPGQMKGTAYECLVAAGVVFDISSNYLIIEDLLVSGAAWAPEEDLMAAHAYDAVGEAEIHEVRVSHGMLVKEDREYPFSCTPAGRAIQVRGPDILINGHNHVPFETQPAVMPTESACPIINIGSVCRISRAESSPRRVILVIVKGGSISWRSIPLKMIDEDEVFRSEEEVDLDAELEDATRHEAIESFVDDLGAELDVLKATPEDLLDRLGAELGADGKKAYETARKYLVDARERLKA